MRTPDDQRPSPSEVRDLTHEEMRDHDGGVIPRYEVDPVTGEVRIRTCTDVGLPF